MRLNKSFIVKRSAKGIREKMAALTQLSGYISHSLDTGNAIWIAQRPATPKRTYGYYRVEVLAALVNGAALLAIAGLVVYEAWERLRSPPTVVSG